MQVTTVAEQPDGLKTWNMIKMTETTQYETRPEDYLYSFDIDYNMELDPEGRPYRYRDSRRLGEITSDIINYMTPIERRPERMARIMMLGGGIVGIWARDMSTVERVAQDLRELTGGHEISDLTELEWD